MIHKILISILTVVMMSSLASANMQTTAKQGYIYDMETNTVLLNKNSTTPMYPASMTKLMTIYLVFELLKDKTLQMSDKFLVSKKAWKKGGSRMFLKINSRVSISDLLRGVIVQSGNDAAIVLAEGIGGTEENFSFIMNSKAKELGMNNTNFVNATGWPHKNHYTTAVDLAILAKNMIEKFPQYYTIWAEKTFKYNNINQHNRNPLLYQNIGADGLKTGHTNDSGYGLIGTFKIKGRRLIMVLNGMKSKKQRKEESLRLALSAIYDYKSVSLLKAGTVLDNAPVWMGNVKSIPLIVKTDIKRTLKKTVVNTVKIKIKYMSPLKTPIKRGDIVGRVIISITGKGEQIIPLYAGGSANKPSLVNQMLNNFNYIVWGKQ